MLIKQAAVATCLLLSLTSAVSAQSKEERLERARRLYSCFSFFSAGSKSTSDISQREKLRRISSAFLIKATSEVLEADDNKDPTNTDLAQKYGQIGSADFKAFMDNVSLLPSEQARNEKIGEFTKGCASSIGAQI